MHRSENTAPKLAILEAAYGYDPRQIDWLFDVGETMRRLVPAAISCFCCEIICTEGRRQLGCTWAEDPRVARQIRMGFAATPPELLDMLMATPLQAATTREVLAAAGMPLEAAMLGGWYEGLGFADVFAMMATDPAGNGVVLGVGLAQPGGPEPRERVAWVHVAAHVAAARRLRADTDEPDLATVLRSAVEQVERARRQAISDSEAIELWQGLVDGRWSLVEQFESDGRRYYVAVRNPADTIKTRALTRREAEVAAYVATGTTTKVTAYALGLDEVTVRGYLRTAMTKLGLSSRAELVALRAALESAGVDSPSGPHSLRP